MSDYPEDLKYSAEHEWVRSGNGSTVRIGITDYAADQLGDIVFASLPSVGETVAAGDACGELESTKSVSDIFSPVPGVVAAVNALLESNPGDHQRRPVRGRLAVRARAGRRRRPGRPAGCRRVRRATRSTRRAASRPRRHVSRSAWSGHLEDGPKLCITPRDLSGQAKVEI